MVGSPESSRDWRRAAIIGGAAYFILFAGPVSIFQAISRTNGAPVFSGAPDFDIEVTILILTCWAAALAAAVFNSVPLRAAPRLLMGLTGFALLVLAETYVSLSLENESPADLMNGFASASGLLRLMGYAAFGLTPLLQIWIRLPTPDEHHDGANSAHH